jgi:hypothetical protein
MVLRVRVPESCADLSPAKVERELEKHFGDITAAARELGVPGPDLRRLIWAQPSLLENAHEELELVVARARGVVIDALDSDDPDRRQWAADKIMSSYLARDNPFAPARRGRAAASAGEACAIIFRWADGEGKLSEASPTAVASRPIPAPPPEPKELPALPVWEGEYGPPPLVANRYQPWSPPPRPRPAPQPSLELERSRPRRQLFRGGWR